MVELAKTHISITDESSSGASSNIIVPLYVFATEQDKAIDDLGNIALGTKKELANTISIVTSRKDVIEKFGIPSFTVVDGTVQQADELNEVGLYGLYDGMGNAAVGYALRADIDLKQLKPTKYEPVAKAKAGTIWLDVIHSEFGLFAAVDGVNASYKRWEEQEYTVCFGEPDNTTAKDGAYLVSFDGSKFTFYEGVEEFQGELLVKKEWMIIGKTKWRAKHPDCKVFVESSQAYPTEGGKGSIWIKKTKPVNGMNLALKIMNSEKGDWEDLPYSVVEDVEDSLTNIALVYAVNRLESNTYTHAIFEFKRKDGSSVDVKISATEPVLPAVEGTLWFDESYMSEDKFASENVIKVNDGQAWKPFEKTIYVRSSDPLSDAEAVVNGDLWIDTDDDNYPHISRYQDGWFLIDNSDQSTPDGIVFGNENNEIIDTNGKILGTYDVVTMIAYDEDLKEIGHVAEDGTVYSDEEETIVIGCIADSKGKQAQAYPKGILLFNMDKTTRVVKKADGKGNWSCESGCEENGAGIFGGKAQRKVIARALAGAIKSCDELTSLDYDFFYACCPGYPELDDELIDLNTAKKELFMIISDTPKRLAPQANAVQAWGTDANNAPSHGEEGRKLKNLYVTRQYPSMGLASNVDGYEVAVPSSIAAMRNLLSLSRGQIPAGTQNGQVINLASVGYITDEDEYSSVTVNDGLGEVLVAQSINPIMPRRNTGLLFWGEMTENPEEGSVLAREHGVITLLRLKRDLEATVQPFFFRINNETTRNDFHQALQSCLSTYISSGEIYDFALVTDSSVNTAERINRNELWADIAIEIARGIEQIYLPIRIVATGSL